MIDEETRWIINNLERLGYRFNKTTFDSTRAKRIINNAMNDANNKLHDLYSNLNATEKVELFNEYKSLQKLFYLIDKNSIKLNNYSKELNDPHIINNFGKSTKVSTNNIGVHKDYSSEFDSNINVDGFRPLKIIILIIALVGIVFCGYWIVTKVISGINWISDTLSSFEVDGYTCEYYDLLKKDSISIVGVADKDKIMDENGGIIIPKEINGLTVKSIKSGAFKDCTALTKITLPFIGASLTASNGYNQVFGYIFGYTTANSSNSGTVSNATYQYYDIYSSSSYKYYIPSSLKEVVITGGNCIPNRAFYNCTSLEKITIGNSVTSIGEYAFKGCNAVIAWGDTPSITSIGSYAFSGYNGTSITIPDSVTSIGSGAFEGCHLLISILIGSNVTNIGSNAFNDCYRLIEVINLSELSITTCNTDNGNIGYYALNIKNSGTSDVINNGNYLFYLYNDIYYLLACVKNSTNLILPDNCNGQDYKIYNSAFCNNTILISITIPNGVTSIGSSAFSSCYSLTSVTIGNSVTSIGSSAFSSCYSLTSVTIGNSVTSIGEEAFYTCTSLTSVTIGDSVTSIGSDAFCGCTSLASVTIPDSVTSIGEDAFDHCYIEEATIPAIASSYINNRKLKKVVITSGDSIPDHAFWCCTSLTSITIPDSVTSIGNYAFEYCRSLRSVELGNNIKTIEAGAFSNCSTLSTIAITSNVTGIEWGVFNDCNSLRNIVFNDTTFWYYGNFTNYEQKTNGTIFDVTNANKNAERLCGIYNGYYFYKK